MTTRDNVHPITDADLAAYRNDAEFRMQNIPMRGVSYDIVAELQKLPNVGGYLVNEPINHVLHVLRRGLCLYYELYRELNDTIDVRQTTFLGSYALFGMSALIVHELPMPEGEQLASFPKSEDDFFRVGLGADDDIKMILSFYLKIVTQTDAQDHPIVESAEDLVNLTRDYFIAARDQMMSSGDAHSEELLSHVDGAIFRIGELELRGFTLATRSDTTTVEFTPVQPEEIVGNTNAKRALLRYVDRLALYDVERGFNPILELGGLPSTVLFDGFPGTGKTSLFRMAMTRLKQHSEQIGLPTHFVTIDPGIKDEYYGRTAKLLNERLGLVRDRRALVLIFFDDIDLLLLSRGDPGMGGADKDVLNITMQFLDGAFTVHTGNAQTYAATNEPTATDSALRQRFHQRELIAGPETWDDYVNLLQVKLTKQLQHGLVQAGGNSVAVPKSTNAQPNTTNGLNLVRSLLPRNSKQQLSWRELGELCIEFKQKDPRFTGRPIESVTQRLLAESADFDIPETWLSDPTVFLNRSYNEKVNLLKTLYRPITGEMIAAALEQYFHSEQRYASEAKVQKTQRLAADLEAQMAARDLMIPSSGEAA